MKSRVLVLGSSGMAGHVVTLRLREDVKIQVFDAGPRTKVFESTLVIDLGDASALEKLVRRIEPEYIVNCVGILIKESERNKPDAIWCNAYLPNLLSSHCAKHNRKLIHLSSDCVFSGRDGPYREDSPRDGGAFYDRTKALGEVENGRDLTIRTSITGPELDPAGTGLFNWFMGQTGRVKGYTRAMWSGVMTTQLAEFVAHVITEQPDLSGILHYSTPNGISKFEILQVFNSVFAKNMEIERLEEPVTDKRLLNTRKDFLCDPPDYLAQVTAMKEWIHGHAFLYPHYPGLSSGGRQEGLL